MLCSWGEGSILLIYLPDAADVCGMNGSHLKSHQAPELWEKQGLGNETKWQALDPSS